MMQRDGLDDDTIASALANYWSAPTNTKIKLTEDIQVVKWTTESIVPTLDGPPLDPIAPAKSAYEFLALHLAGAIYDDDPPLKAIREGFAAKKLDPAFVWVERLEANNIKPFHGLFFEGNLPYAIVQVRYFGCVAVRVHFKTLSIGGSRFIYTHDLEQNAESVSEIADSSTE